MKVSGYRRLRNKTVIYTITLNPSLDRAIDVEEFIYDDVNTIVEQKRSAGGKGIDVSRVIRELGGQSIAFGFMGGYNGLEIEGRLANEGIVCDFTRINGETRENVVIHQRKKKTQTLLATSAPEVAPFDATVLLNKIKQIPRDSYVVMSGRLPPGLNDNFYAQVITSLKERNIRTFLDTDGEPLKQGVQAGPCLFKPNIHELGRLVEKNIKDQEEVVENVVSYLNVSEYVVVSMGARGAIGASQDGSYQVVPPKVTVKSPIGAGDALMAGVVYGLSEGMGFEDALSLGVACGTASTLAVDSASCSREDVYEIRRAVVTKKV
jgi:6-phosphofructokinase 2